jgi:hypothetical protein
MELMTDEVFCKWASARSITVEPQFAARLLFTGAPSLAREWRPPPVPSDLEGFVTTLLRAASATGPFWLYRRGGGNWYEDEESPLSDQNRNRIIAITGVPRDFGGALGFQPEEWRDLLLVILAFYVFGWEVGGDLQIVPEDGLCILQTSHHGPVEVRFANEARMRAFVQAMAEKRFPVERTA